MALLPIGCSDDGVTSFVASDAFVDVADIGGQGPIHGGGGLPDVATDAFPPGEVFGADVAEGAFGAPCTTNTDCESGWCVVADEGPVCTKLCLADCPSGWSCVGVTNTGVDVVFLCIPVTDNLCSPCTEDFQCGEGICATFDDGRACTRPCDAVSGCPDGYECQDATSERKGTISKQCVPKDGGCSCTPSTHGKARSCKADNEHGTCWGQQVCDGEDGWGPCSAAVPEAEVCDGADNDCDGLSDDGVQEPEEPCEGTSMAGTCAGSWSCGGQAGWVCDAKTPAFEVCDYVDNDCDGSVDEDFRDGDAYAALEHCGACNNDCTGLYPNGTSICDATGVKAVCSVGACDEGYYASGDFLCLPVESSLCAPCKTDLNCVVPGDLCLAVSGGTFCGQDCAPGSVHGEGCPDGYTCTETGGGHQCMPTSGTCDCLPESDGLSRSCVVKNANGTCYGTQVCDAAAGWGVCDAALPQAEVCDGFDNDCDGVADEGVVAPAEPCVSEWSNEVTGETAVCDGVWVCLPDDTPDGWVCLAPEAGPEVCDYKDNDCDGLVDEDFRSADGAYVSLDHCAACNFSCQGSLPNATAGCDGSTTPPSCVVQTCAPGFYQASPSTCLPVKNTACQPCASDAGCVVPGNLCLVIDGSSYCGRDCSAGNLYGAPEGDCPDGTTCVATGGGKQCVPTTGSCTCKDAGHADKARSCIKSGPSGTCTGIETCDPAVGWSDCDATAPSPETCNGKDDDCDGLVDDGVTAPTEPCQQSNANGTCTGAWSCSGGAGWTCNAAVPAAETCNSKDDDCDGTTDEDFRDAATGKYAVYEHCGLCGNSCEGAVPFATATDCAMVSGKAMCVATACQPDFTIPEGSLQVCVPVTGGFDCSPCVVDKDCQGLSGGKCEVIDGHNACTRGCASTADCNEGYQCTLGRCVPASLSCDCLPAHAGMNRPCTVENGSGTCFGLQTCNPAAGWSGCTAATPKAEECDGVDNDCDGFVDEGVAHDPPVCVLTNQWGTCDGPYACKGAAGWECTTETPEPEACDFLDNDCDGLVDEDFRAGGGTGPYVDDGNCGTCGLGCFGVIPDATASCAENGGKPRCEVTSCDVGYYQAGPVSCLAATESLCQPCQSDANCPTPGDRCVTLDGGGFCGRDCSAGNVYGAPAGQCPTGFTCAEQSGGKQCVPISASCSCLPGDTGNKRSCAITNGAGTCFGQQTCDPAAGWSGCTAKTPVVEACNGKDDDCDGLVDEGVAHDPVGCQESNAFGTCAGDWLCQGSAGWACTASVPAAEICNWADDDCDGLADEDFTSGGLYVSQDHCGACGASCDGAIPNATSKCAISNGKARCEVASCAPGSYQTGPLTCVAATDDTCAPCATDASCPTPGDLCLAQPGGSFCGRDCGAGNLHGTPEGTCPTGFTCKATDGAKQCVPVSGACTCLSGDAGDKQPCAATNGQGTCFGEQTCDPASGWSACSAKQPAAEVCNGKDDDCDGLTDDVTGRGAACTIDNAEGSCAGTMDCTLGSETLSCVGKTPKTETCNAQDDDCDGQTDEGFLVGGKYVHQEHCGACGASCTGAVTNADMVCDASSGAPVCVIAACHDGFIPVGGECVPIALGLCEPCSDASGCMVQGAKCAALFDGSYCVNPCGAGGSCPTGYTCKAMTGGSFCAPNTNACQCNGNNLAIQKGCSVDYTPSEGQGYACLGLQTCMASGWSPCVLPGESCNSFDDDCDGSVDEGFLDADDRYTTDENCGACGNNCTLLVFEGGGGTCNTYVDPPVCSLLCSGTCFDVNANPNDGCECCDPTPIDLPDPQGIDANCDGIDGEKDNGIFVSKEGDDTLNDGSLFSPKRTIAAGIAAAVAQGKRDVYVATGVYEESFSLAKGKGVYGGYSSDFLQRNATLYEVAILAPAPVAQLPGAVNCIGVQGGAAGATVFAGFSVFGYHVKTSGGSSYAVYAKDCDASLRVSNNAIHAGSGGKGQRGLDGEAGSHGSSGGDGMDALDLLEVYGVLEHQCQAAQHSVGGTAGKSACGGQAVDGGAGGNRVCPSWDDATGGPAAPVASENGKPSATGAPGGKAGWDTFHQAYQCLGYATFGDVEGANGADAGNGTVGSSGSGCDDADGSVTGGTWTPSAAGTGTSGAHGGGGGGGGSGGGAWVHTSCFSKGFGYDNLGGTGGGGGSGGCGGTAGTGGTGGGGAFGLFVTFTVPMSAPSVFDNAFWGGFGGDGGAGGNAGSGGAGGAGGFGGTGGGNFDPPDPTYPSFKGGKGGKGGNGGHGGGGGGGCGGPAFGIFVHDAGGADLSGWKGDNAFMKAGEGGLGGFGGFSLGQPGGDGASGITMDTNF